MAGALADKVIIVAGAGGIGSGLAREFAAQGAAVIVGDVSGEAAQQTADDIVTAGGKAFPQILDGADDTSIAAAVAAAIDNFGGLDGFYANFACFHDGEHGGDVLDLPMEVYAMIARGGGTMLYTSSGAAHQGLPQHSAYAMSKAAVHALMRHVAARFGPRGIRANVIAPGVVTHSRFEAVMDAALIAQMRAGANRQAGQAGRHCSDVGSADVGRRKLHHGPGHQHRWRLINATMRPQSRASCKQGDRRAAPL